MFLVFFSNFFDATFDVTFKAFLTVTFSATFSVTFLFQGVFSHSLSYSLSYSLSCPLFMPLSTLFVPWCPVSLFDTPTDKYLSHTRPLGVKAYGITSAEYTRLKSQIFAFQAYTTIGLLGIRFFQVPRGFQTCLRPIASAGP